MAEHRNHLGQPVGAPVAGWSPRPRPPRTAIEGRFCTIEPLDPERHAAQLFAAYAEDREGRMWTYPPRGPYASPDEYRSFAETASYMRIEPSVGVIEIGSITYSPRLQRRPAATEAMYLMMRRVFDELGYRRYEWKCDSLNQPSREAAARLGFRYEGLFRQASITRGRNRDTTWFSVIDREWPILRAAFEAWLDPGNFDADGRQLRNLASFRPDPA